MADARIVINGYGQLELNQVTFPRTGQVEAQCKLADTFTDAAPAEVGMLLAVDKANGLVKLPVTAETLPVALNYSTEKIYNQFTPGLKNFYQTAEKGFLPRMGYLSVGEVFTTNCLARNTTDFTNDEAAWTALDSLGTTPVYGGISTTGAIALSKAKPTVGPVLKAVKKTTMPDGQPAVKFQVQ